jgi:hypothetical protein
MKNISIVLLFLVNSQLLFSQGGSFTMTYPVAFPMSDLHSYTSNISWRGFNMEFNKHQKKDLDVGMEIGWNVFYGREDAKIYTDGTASLSGIQYRYTNAVPMLAQLKWYKVSDKKPAAPYLGLGIGTIYVNRSTDFGIYRITNEAWQFCLRPEAGIVFKTGRGVEAMLAAKYYAGFGSSDLDGQSYLTINIGFVFSSGW